MQGSLVHQYKILRQLGSGGMGVVYEAEDTRLGRMVAIKFLPELLQLSPEASERFEREATLACALNHPNICKVHDVGIFVVRRFFVMERLEGDSLTALIKGEPLPIDQILDVGSQIADALDAAHAKGIVHRDLKPANIFITARGQAKLLDFGVATAGTALAADGHTRVADGSLTTPGTAIGSVNYMSPEQARGEALDGRTDLFSLGLVLYEMATGRQAFGGQTAAVVFDGVLNRDPIPVQQVNPAIPVELEHIITRALEKDRRMRYQSAADLQVELTRLRRDTTNRQVAPVNGPASPSAANATQPASGLPLLPILAALGVVVLAAAGYWYWQKSNAQAFTERGLVVIADFDNKTGDAVFDDALRQAVSVQLQQSPFITLLPDSTVQRTLRLMSRSADQALDSATARELCQRAGAQASVEGSIAPLGSAYVISLGVYNCESGASLAQEQVQAASKEEVLSAMGTAVTGLRERLGESLSSIEKYDVPITEATTRSLDALKAYGQAHRARQTRGDEAAIPFYQQAVSHDPQFALAYAKLGVLSANTGRADDSKKYTEQAYALRDRVTAYERLHIEWSHATRVTNDRARARQTLEMMVDSYPGDFAARNNLGVLLMQIAEFEKALQQYEEAAAIAPNEPLPISNAAYAKLFLGRLDEAFVLIEKALTMRPDPNLQIARWSAARTSGHPRAAEFETTARELANPQQLLLAEGNLAVWEGRIGDYRRTVAQQMTQAMSIDGGESAQGIAGGETITMAVVQGGDWIPKVKALINDAPPPQGVAQIAAALAVIGDIDLVRTWLPRLEKMDASDPQQMQPAVVARALVMAADGRSRDGAALIESYLVQNPRSLELHYYLGLLHERSGAIEEAIASYRLAVQAQYVVGPNPAVMASRLSMGRLLKSKGDTAGANEQFDSLARQWANADADFAMAKALRDAR